MWHQPVASRRDEESGNDFGRVWLDGEVILVGLVVKDDEDGTVDLVNVGGVCGFGLGSVAEGVVEAVSVERVFRFVGFAGDSRGGRKSLG